MRKKLLSSLLVLTMTATLFAGCSKKADDTTNTNGAEATVTVQPETQGTASYKAGTYEGVGQGMHGDIKLSVTFSDTEITGIEVVSQTETEGISDPAFDKLPKAIMDSQSLGVDTISGCTLSSKGILDAVADAAKQAGADVDALKNKEVTAPVAGTAIEETADVVVVGGGGAGMAAAASACENGASVIVLEKTAAVGGNTLASGLAMNAADPEVQSKLDTMSGQVETLKGVLDYNEADFGDFADTLKTLKGQITTYLAGDTSKMFDSVEWHIIQTYLGGKRTDANGNHYEGKIDLVTKLCSESLDAYHWLGDVVGVKEVETLSSPVGSMWMRAHGFETKLGVFTASEDYITSHNGSIMLETKVEHLIVENGKVTGVTGTKVDGTPVTVHATKGVILATGGFGANAAMVKQYNTYWPTIPDDTKTTCVASAEGDGIELGLEANANLVDMGVTQLMPTASAVTGALADGILVPSQDYLFVNKEGVRFVNEYAERDVISSAVLKQTDGLFFTIADSEMAKVAHNKLTPEKIDDMVSRGIILKADTIEDLAAQIGCDATTLQDSIDKYNSYVDTGVDPEFGKNVFELKVATAPFYAVPSKPSVHHTMGGLQINVNTEVLDTNGNVIPGLYAAGEVTGGIHAGNRLGGNAIADCMVYGRTAGKNAAAN